MFVSMDFLFLLPTAVLRSKRHVPLSPALMSMPAPGFSISLLFAHRSASVSLDEAKLCQARQPSQGILTEESDALSTDRYDLLRIQSTWATLSIDFKSG